jgi:hypothetical protein
MLCYGLLAAIAGITLTGRVLQAVLVFFAGLAIKTWVGELRAKQQREIELASTRGTNSIHNEAEPTKG